MTTLLIILAVLLSSILWLIHPFLLLLYRQSVSPLRHLPSPDLPSSSGWFKRFFMGHLPLLHDAENTGILNTWASQFPNGTFVYKGFVGGCRLMTTDPVAVGYILKNGYAYPKPDFVRDSLATMAAGHEGLLTSEGEMHKKQVRSVPHLLRSNPSSILARRERSSTPPSRLPISNRSPPHSSPKHVNCATCCSA